SAMRAPKHRDTPHVSAKASTSHMRHARTGLKSQPRPEPDHHQNTFTSSGISFSPSHCIGVSGTSRVPSHSAKCGPLTGGSGPSASGIAIVIDEWVVFAVNVPAAVCGDDPASVHICCVNRYADVGCAVPTLVSACQP